MLPTYQNILVAIDFTENSDHAFKHAVLLARLHDAKIHLMHVIQQIDMPYMSSMLGQEKKLDSLRKQHEQDALAKIQEQLDKFVKTELADYPEDQQRFAETRVFIGNTMLEILGRSDQLNADVIVMGTHSKGVLEHAFLGSVAEKVLQRAKCPVFTIPLPS